MYWRNILFFLDIIKPINFTLIKGWSSHSIEPPVMECGTQSKIYPSDSSSYSLQGRGCERRELMIFIHEFLFINHNLKYPIQFYIINLVYVNVMWTYFTTTIIIQTFKQSNMWSAWQLTPHHSPPPTPAFRVKACRRDVCDFCTSQDTARTLTSAFHGADRLYFEEK